MVSNAFSRRVPLEFPVACRAMLFRIISICPRNFRRRGQGAERGVWLCLVDYFLEMEDELQGKSGAYSSSHTINGHSVVLQFKYGNVRFLYTGDLNQESCLELLKKMRDGNLNLDTSLFR